MTQHTEQVIEILETLKDADEAKRLKSDIPVISNKINWDYLIEAVKERSEAL